MIGRITQWLLSHSSPKARLAEKQVTESTLALQDKRSAVSRLARVLDLEIERDLSEIPYWSGHQDRRK